MIISLFVFLLTITVLIVIHEYGHYWTAMRFGIKVSRFSVGFGKVVWSLRRANGVEFALSCLPFGGYVRLVEDNDPTLTVADQQHTFNRQSLLKRTAVVFAGPAVNVLFALVVYSIVFLLGIDYPKPVIDKVLSHSVAAHAGFQPGDEIVAIAGENTSNWAVMAMQLVGWVGDRVTLPVLVRERDHTTFTTRQLSLDAWRLNDLQPDFLQSLGILPYQPEGPLVVKFVEQSEAGAWAGILPGDRFVQVAGQPVTTFSAFIQQVNTHAGRPLNVHLVRGDHQLDSVLDVGKKKNWLGHVRGYVGIEFYKLPWPADMLRTHQVASPLAVWAAGKEIAAISGFNYVVIGKMLVGKISLSSLGGPVSLFQGTALALRQGIIHYLNFVAFLSTSLAIVNLLPIPGLDGGYVIYFLAEKIRGRPLSSATQTLLARLGVIFLIVVIVQAVANDVLRLAL